MWYEGGSEGADEVLRERNGASGGTGATGGFGGGCSVTDSPERGLGWAGLGLLLVLRRPRRFRQVLASTLQERIRAGTGDTEDLGEFTEAAQEVQEEHDDDEPHAGGERGHGSKNVAHRQLRNGGLGYVRLFCQIPCHSKHRGDETDVHHRANECRTDLRGLRDTRLEIQRPFSNEIRLKKDVLAKHRGDFHCIIERPR